MKRPIDEDCNAILLNIFTLALFFLATALNAFPQQSTQGRWSTLSYSMPINPIHAALLNNGRVLVVAGSGNNPPVTNFQAAVWDPKTGSITTQPVAWDMFCNGMIVLTDGRPLIDGGTLQYNPFSGAPNASVFDPVLDRFTDLTNMADGRWYPTVTELPDGTVMTFSGLRATGGTDTAVEVFSPSTWSWSQPFSAGWTPPLYPRLHLLPNGTVFYSGSGYKSRFYYPATHKWSKPVATTNFASNRTYGSSVLLPLTPENGYKPTVMILGGGAPTATATTELIDLSSSTPTWKWGPPMSQARVEMNAVMLPTGKILALGGSGTDENASTASYNADLYDPGTNNFSSAGQNAFPRLYHSVAMLLPDATVWLAGSNPKRGTYEPRMEIYEPAYLFDSSGNPATRPTISSAPKLVNYGQGFTVGTPDATNIASVVLVRPGAVTHAFDMDQRLVGMSFTTGAGLLSVTAPPNSNIAPPGYYMLFLLNRSGVPSVATFLQLTAGADFSITPSPAQHAIVLGQDASFTLQTSPSGGENSNISLSISGVPSGASASYMSNPVGDGSSTVLTFSSANLNPAILPQTYMMTATGTNGTLTRSAPLHLVVNSPGDFALSTSASAMTITRGGPSGQVVVTLTPSGGFVGATTFTVTGLAPHVTAVFNPGSLTSSGSTTLSLTAAASAGTSTRTLTITGTSGTLIHTAKIKLTVQ